MIELVGESRHKMTAVVLVVFMISLVSSCAKSQISPVRNATFTAPPEPTYTHVPLTATPTATGTPEIKIVILDESTSPDGNWTAVVSLTMQDTKKYLEFRVSNNSEPQKWIVEQLDWDELQTSTSWVPFPYIFQWSKDNHSLFYSFEPNSNDGCFGYFRPGGYGLKKIDLVSGDSSIIREDNATWMALSPDETQLAYIDTFGGNVSILNIQSGEERKYELPAIKNEQNLISDTSDLYWSPDGDSLIYAYHVGACDLLVPYSNIIQLTPESGRQQVLVDNSEKGYIPQEWVTEDGILLKDSDGNQWWLNPGTKEITAEQQ